MSNQFNNLESNLSIRTKLNANTAVVEDKVSGRRYASAQKNVDTPNTVTISSGDVNTFVKIPLTFDYTLLKGFSLITNGLKYTNATSRIFEFHGVSTVGTSVVNTTVHFRLAINGVTVAGSESAAKLDSSTSLSTIAGVILIELDFNDEIEIYVEVDKACTISAYHTALTLVEV